MEACNLNLRGTRLNLTPYKLDGVGPVDNRPSTDKLHHFVQKRRRKKREKKWHFTCDMWHVTCDMWHVTCDMWHVTCDMWHVTCDTWHVWGNEHSLKISASLLFVIYDIMNIWRKRMIRLINESVTRLFIEQPRLHRVCWLVRDGDSGKKCIVLYLI